MSRCGLFRRLAPRNDAEAQPRRAHRSWRVNRPFGTAARTAGLDADWHTRQRGWLGAAVLVDVHRVRPHCCQAARRTADRPVYHWVFKSPGRLALPTYGRGFTGLRPVSWAALVRRSARNTLSDITATVNKPNQIVGAFQ